MARWKIPAAWLIERSGFQGGIRDGRVGLSTKHPLPYQSPAVRRHETCEFAAASSARSPIASACRCARSRCSVGFSDDPDVDF